MSCNFIYLPCFSAGKTQVCECNDDKTSELRVILSYMQAVRKRKFNPREDCIYSDKVYDEYSKIMTSINAKSTQFCFEQIICNEDYIRKLYTDGGIILKHPDIILIKSKSFTFIVELKSFGKQNQSLIDQLEDSLSHLPSNLRSPCTAVIYMPKGGGTLPLGYVIDNNTYKLQKILGKNKRLNVMLQKNVFIYVYQKGIHEYL